MQLNSLSLNCNRANRQLNLKLAVYDHKLARIHQEIFIFGKSFSQIQTQTSLYKLNTLNLTLENIHILNAPSFEQFIMFSFRQILYFWGQTHSQSLNQLYSFDGSKFKKLDQNGPIPKISFGFTNCIFSDYFLLVFGYFYKDQYFDNWYILNLMTHTWKQVKSNISIPFSQKATLIWKNGKGYLLLTNSFDKKIKQYKKNCLYEISFESFNKFILKCEQISIDNKIIDQNILFQHFFSFHNNHLMFMGNKELTIQKNSQQNNYQQKIYNLNLETFQWSQTKSISKIKGLWGQIFCYQNSLIYVGGVHNQKLVDEIQILNYNIEQQNFSENIFSLKTYQQSRCYYCQQAFTYIQNSIYEPFINKDFDSYSMKEKVQMKFYRKLSLQFVSQFQAIGVLVDYLRQCKTKEIQINLKEQISQKKQFHFLRKNIENQVSQILCLEGISQKAMSSEHIYDIFFHQQQQLQENYSNTYIQFSRLIMASLKIGTGLLFITLTQQYKIFVGYVSCSSTEFPQINVKSFSKIYYTINLKTTEQNRFSSLLNRSIIFENVSLYFGNPQLYEKISFFQKINKKKLGQFPQYLFVVGASNLQKTLKNQEFSPLVYEDIVLKNRKKTQIFNSLQKYLRHLYLNQQSVLKLENSLLNSKNIIEVFENLQKNRFIKLITVRQEKAHKNQLDQTHFSTSHEETINWKKIDDVEKCILYSINSNKIKKIDIYYQGIFVYHLKRLIKVINLKNKTICGIVQMNEDTQIRLTKANFSQKTKQRKLQKWLEQIQESILPMNSNIQV